MTGATTTMSATHAGTTKKEGRDPSPSLKPASSGSSDDEVEPWDEPPSKQREASTMSSNPIGDMMKSVNEFLGVGTKPEDEGLEDGDLPTLSLKKNNKRVVTGQYVSGEKSTRPLSPPSSAGMMTTTMEEEVKDNDPPMRRSRAPTPRTAKQAAAQRQFWSQLNPPSPFESDVSRTNTERSTNDDAAVEGPDDEMAAVTAARAKTQTSQTREIQNTPKQEDETVEGDESYRGNVAKAHSYEEGSGTCIEYTLASIGDICGTGQSKTSKIKDSHRPTKVREVRDDMADDAEEHTAIEVEYVDPGPLSRRSPSPPAAGAVPSKKKKEKKKQEKSMALSPKQAASSKTNGNELPTSRALDGESVELQESEASAWSSSRKNAVLAAMARKAKEDFQKHEEQVSNQGSAPLSSSRGIASPSHDQENTSDVYNSFSPSEKRKFLKLINLGLTPSESTARVVEERKDKEGPKTPGSAKKRFSLWKKKGKVGASPPPAVAASSDAQSVSSTAAVGEAEDSVVHQGDSDAAAKDDDLEPSSPRANVESDEAATNKAYSPRASDSAANTTLAASPGEKVADDHKEVEGAGSGSGSMPSTDSADSAEVENDKSSNAAAMAVAAGAAAAGVGAVAAHQAAVNARQSNKEVTASYEADDDETSDEDDSVRGKFPRSGVNYYDGIRRELPEQEDSDDEFGSEIHSPEKPHKGSRLASLTSTPKSQGFSSLHSDRNLVQDEEGPKSVSKSLSPLGRKSSSKDRSTPLSPGASTSARRRYLGIPMLSTGKGFTPLEEDDDSAVAKAVQEDLTTERSSPPSDQVQSAVAAAAAATVGVAAVAAAAISETDAPDVAGGPSEERPLPSMDDPFYGIEDAAAQKSGDQAAEATTERAEPEDKFDENLVQPSEMDTSLDSYLDSATIQSYGVHSQHDQHSTVAGSVMSSRSGYTAGTGMTGHTQSSRKRRPGAAKERIAKAKKAGANSTAAKGWHESIRAAAASNNREWDPQKGWVDYKDPTEDAQDTSEERLHISLDGVNMRSPRATSESQQVEGSQSPSVAVPFPSGWKKERDEMLSPKKAEAISREGPASGTPPLSPRPVTESGQSQNVRVQLSDEQDRSSPKPRGWEDSMREASAGVSKDGRRWDPERGWVGLDKNVVDGSPISPRKSPVEEDSVSEEGKDPVDAASPNAIFAALTKAPSKEAHEYAESETRSAEPRSPPAEAKMDKYIEKSAKSESAASKSENSNEGSDQAVVAGVGEKYVQLGENGAVKSVRPRKHPSEREEKLPFHPTLRKVGASRAARPNSMYDDDDKAPLLIGDSSDSTEQRAPATKVVKQKVDEDDFSLFTADDPNTVASGSLEGSPSRSKRRSTGPIDVDEVDDLDTETESEDADEENTWEPDSYMKGQVSPGMFVKPRSERSAERDFAPISPPSKTPPKLEKSRRDTSPIRSTAPTERDVNSSQEVISPRQVVSPVASPRAAMSSPEESRQHDSPHARAIEPTVSTGDDSVGSSSVKQMTKQWEIRARHGTPIVHDQSGDSFEYDERQVTALGDFGPSEQVEWSGYTEKESTQPTSSGTQEWRSFIGKKVAAESVAAASMDENNKKRDASSGVAAKAGIPRAPGGPAKRVVGMDRAVPDENGDSSFSFGPSEGDVDSPALSASSAAARRRDRAQQQSSPGGFSDVSPIPAREEDFAIDDARMERVSDTGTAVEQSSFMKRLSACAAPISRAFTQASGGDGMPSSHLEFLKTNPAGQSPSGSGRYVPAALCGRQDIIKEDDDDGSDEEDDSKRSLDETQETDTASPPESPTSRILREVKQRSTSRGRSRQAAATTKDPISDMRSTASSSVVSDDNFGARTSYLEAIALRSAVSSTSSSKKKKRRPRERDNESFISDATSDSKQSHAERWQAFLQRKASQSVSPPGSQANTDVSRAAERYASEKMEEMMEVMASRSKSTPKNWKSQDAVDYTLDTSYGDDSTASPLSPYRLAGGEQQSSSRSSSKKKRESAKAAEELAAARVEAMMAAMTSSNLDEGEI